MKKNLVLAAIIISAGFFLSDANILQEFMPRSACMFQNERLIMLHLVSDAAIFLSYMGIGSVLFVVWKVLQRKGFPFSDFFWKFGGFIICCGVTHLVSVVNIFVTYYWIDGIVKLATAWFSVLTCITLFKSYRAITSLETPAEFKALTERLKQLMDRLKKYE